MLGGFEFGGHFFLDAFGLAALEDHANAAGLGFGDGEVFWIERPASSGVIEEVDEPLRESVSPRGKH